MEEQTRIHGTLGWSAHRRVFLGFAPANTLAALSFADVLDEDTGRGYQRRFDARHSLDFRNYIQAENSSTIPLTLNLRPDALDRCSIVETTAPYAYFEIAAQAERVFAQVDCQHRLGHLHDVAVLLPFMCYLGLTEREEMEVFNIINGKAHGLSASLLDFHDARLAQDLAGERPELFAALILQNTAESPWYRQLDLGGVSTSGLQRRASLRTMQKAIRRFLRHTQILHRETAETAAQVILAFWKAVELTLPDAWRQPRRFIVCKGVGVYTLMNIAADLYLEAEGANVCDKRYFSSHLSEFIAEIDWSNRGPFRGLGGEGGVLTALQLLRDARKRSRLRMVTNA